MSQITYGITGSAFGAPIWLGKKVQSYNRTYKPNVVATIANETGSICTRRYDDIETGITVEFFKTSGSNVEATQTFTYDGTTYICTQVAENGTFNNFTKYTVDGITSEYISLS